MIFGQDGEPKEGLEEPPDLIGSRFVRDSEFVTAYVVNQRWVGLQPPDLRNNNWIRYGTADFLGLR